MNPPDLKNKKKVEEKSKSPEKKLDTSPSEPPKPKVSPMAKLFMAMANKQEVKNIKNLTLDGPSDPSAANENNAIVSNRPESKQEQH